MPTGPKYTNALAKVTNSPYLLQHAHNPVDWYPWCEQAFEKAKRENKPIFLSIGYSTCHWCHVMADESFENEDIAKMLNENFLSIKVDRETQPDVDATYMMFVQATTHHGGWPLSVFLTPELHPIFGGTYFPPVDQLGRPGFPTVLRRIAAMWKSDADKLRQSGMNILQQLRDALTSSSSSSTAASELESFSPAHKTFASYCGRFDSNNGGFSVEPKFPTPVTLHFLLRYHYFMSAAAARAQRAESATMGDLQRLCDELGSQKGAVALEKTELVDAVKSAGACKAVDAQKALDMTCFTLKKIAYGGIHDHVGSGFHRYSTDERWHIPHFEKMLYDQALLACAYAEAYSVTKEKELGDAARDIMQYVKETLTHPEGGFYSAEDADSYSYEGANRKKEGAFYVYTADEIASLLKGEDLRIFNMHYSVEQGGNVDPVKDVQGELKNQNVLMAQRTPEDTARKAGVSVETVRDIIERGKSLLKSFRKEKRPPPHLDDKILVAWNGLMISGCVTTGNLLEKPEYIGMAERAGAFIRKYAYDEPTKKLCRSVRGKEKPVSTGEGFADDYAYLIRGLLDLYEATFRETYALWAIDLQKQQDSLFWDANGGGYFGSPEKPDIVLRLKPEHDGAEPSVGSVTAENLMRLGGMTGDGSYAVKAKELIKSYQATLVASPTSMPYLVASLMMANKGTRSIGITGNAEDDEGILAFRHAASCCFVPDKVLWQARPGGVLAELNQVGKAMVTRAKGRPAVFICTTGACGPPIEDPAKLRESLLAK